MAISWPLPTFSPWLRSSWTTPDALGTVCSDRTTHPVVETLVSMVSV